MKGMQIVSWLLLLAAITSGIGIFGDIQNENPAVTAWASLFAIGIIYQSIHVIKNEDKRK